MYERICWTLCVPPSYTVIFVSILSGAYVFLMFLSRLPVRDLTQELTSQRYSVVVLFISAVHKHGLTHLLAVSALICVVMVLNKQKRIRFVQILVYTVRLFQCVYIM